MTIEDKRQPIPIKTSVLSYTVPKPPKDLEVPVTFRVSTETKYLIAKMLRDCGAKVGWVTPGQFLRWATDEGLKKVVPDLQNKQITNMFHHLQAAKAILIDDEVAEGCGDILQRTRDRVKHCDDVGMFDHVPKLLREIKKEVDQLEPNDWTVHFRKQWYKEFGERLEQGKISPRPRDAVKED